MSIFDIQSQAYHQPNSIELFKLNNTILVYVGICNERITLAIHGVRADVRRRLTINGINYAVIFVQFSNKEARRSRLYSVNTFRIGGYVPYVLKDNYSFQISDNNEFNEAIIDRYLEHLTVKEERRTNTFNRINCAIVHGRDNGLLINFIKSQLVRGDNTLFAEHERDILTFNPIIHSNLVINFPCNHLSRERIELLTAVSNRRYIVADISITFPDHMKLVFLTRNDGGVVFTNHLDHVGQQFRIIEVTRSDIHHESLIICV